MSDKTSSAKSSDISFGDNAAHNTVVTGGVAGDIVLGDKHVYEAPAPTVTAPFMAGDLPENYVHRSREFNSLIDALLKLDGAMPIAITAALNGAGGYGKTTMAKALCHDNRIRRTYKDGILWVTLGQSPNLVG